MDWIRVDVNLMSHPKLRRLSTRLGCTKAQALGHVVSLWSWACKFSPHGKTDKFEPEEIADGAMWDGDPNLFANAMIEVGLIDDDGMLHDWRQYNGVIIEKKERDRDRIRMIRNTSCDSRTTVRKCRGNGTDGRNGRNGRNDKRGERACRSATPHAHTRHGYRHPAFSHGLGRAPIRLLGEVPER